MIKAFLCLLADPTLSEETIEKVLAGTFLRSHHSVLLNLLSMLLNGFFNSSVFMMFTYLYDFYKFNFF